MLVKKEVMPEQSNGDMGRVLSASLSTADTPSHARETTDLKCQTSCCLTHTHLHDHLDEAEDEVDHDAALLQVSRAVVPEKGPNQGEEPDEGTPVAAEKRHCRGRGGGIGVQERKKAIRKEDRSV